MDEVNVSWILEWLRLKPERKNTHDDETRIIAGHQSKVENQDIPTFEQA